MATDTLPPDDDQKARWHDTKPPPLAPATDPAHFRCVSCKELLPLIEAAMDYGVNAKGNWIGLGLCLSCRPPQPDPMTDADYAAHEARQ